MIESLKLGFKLILYLTIIYGLGLIIWCFIKPDLDKFCDWLEQTISQYRGW